MPARDRTTILPLLTTGPVLAVIAWWALDSGGYFPTDWLPGVLVVYGLLAVAAVSLGGGLRSPSRVATAAVSLLGGYAAWSFASIAWAAAPAAALEGAQRTLLYLGCFALFALVPWTVGAARAALVAAVVTIGGVGAITLARIGVAEDPLRLFIDARLAAPLGYQNAAAALWTMGALPALLLASRRETRAILRPPLLALSGLLLALALMAESRGWLFTLPVIAAVMLAIVPGRLRLVLFAAPVAAALAVASGAILDVYRVAGGLTPAAAARVAGPPIDHAVSAIALMTLAIGLAGVALIAAERRLLVGPARAAGVHRALSRAAIGLAALAVVALVAVAATQDLPGRADRAWSQFRDVTSTAQDQSDVRFTSLGSGRYDFWRVGIDLWLDHPIGGAGQDNFAQPYVRERRTFEEPRWVHSLPLRLLVHTGIVGALLFAGFVLAIAAAAAQAWRRRQVEGDRAVLAAALLAMVVWLIHGSVDWLWEYPVLSALALAGAGIAVAASAGDDRCAWAPGERRGPVLHAALVAGAGVLLVLVVPSYIADRDVRDAAAGWPSNPPAAFARLHRAQSLDVLGAQPWLVEGLIAGQSGRPVQARRALLVAGGREPESWLVDFALGLTAPRGRAATASLQAARRLNPREPTIAEALQRERSNRPMTLVEANLRFQQRAQARQGR